MRREVEVCVCPGAKYIARLFYKFTRLWQSVDAVIDFVSVDKCDCVVVKGLLEDMKYWLFIIIKLARSSFTLILLVMANTP